MVGNRMRRRFIVVANTAADFERSAALIARCVSASLMLSHSLRSDTDLVLASMDGVAVYFMTQRLRNVRPDESSLMGILRKAFRALGSFRQTVHSGVVVARRDFRYFMQGFQTKYLCSTRGKLLNEVPPKGSVAFVIPFSPEVNVPSENLVPLRCPLDRIWPDHLIAVLNIELDRWCARAGHRGTR